MTINSHVFQNRGPTFQFCITSSSPLVGLSMYCTEGLIHWTFNFSKLFVQGLSGLLDFILDALGNQAKLVNPK